MFSVVSKRNERSSQQAIESAEALLAEARISMFSQYHHAAALISTVAFLISLLVNWQYFDKSVLINYTILIGFTWFLRIKWMPTKLQPMFTILLVYLAGIFEMMNFGGTGQGRVVFLLMICTSACLYNIRITIGLILLCSTTLFLLTQLLANGFFTTFSLQVNPTEIYTQLFNFIAVCLIISSFFNHLMNVIKQRLIHERELSAILQKQTAALSAALERESELTQSLSVSLDQEKHLNTMLENLITTVSHEFRTPMSIIRNSSGMLQQHYEALSGERRTAHFMHIDNNIERLAELTSQIVTRRPTSSDEWQDMLYQIDLQRKKSK